MACSCSCADSKRPSETSQPAFDPRFAVLAALAAEVIDAAQERAANAARDAVVDGDLLGIDNLLARVERQSPSIFLRLSSHPSAVFGNAVASADDSKMPSVLHPLLLIFARVHHELASMVQYLKAENTVLRSKLPKVVQVTPRERHGW